jgi:NADH dehydrogenase
MAGRPRVVIVGGGFGGLAAARALRGAAADVTLVDRRNHHLFQPLLYQVASAALDPSDIASPIRTALRDQANARVILAEVTGVDVAGRRVLLADGALAYDELILAAGAGHAYFGRDEWAKDAPGLKTLEDALEIRRRVLFAFEAAERCEDEAERRAWLTFVVVGGGATGTELAGALGEIARHAMERDFRRIDPASARVVLVEGGAKVLGGYPEALSDDARRQLEKLGVEVRCSARVTAIDPLGVNIGAERLPARTVLWAAGVAASSVARTLGVPLDRAGRVLVGRDLTIPGHPEVQVVGDLAALEQDGKPVFGVAPAAMQAGRHAARNVLASLAGRAKAPFRYVDKGSLATIGRKAAVGVVGGRQLRGLVAWLAWLFIHVLFLVSFRSKLEVLFRWVWSYVTFQRGSRLITGDLGPLERRSRTPEAPPPPTPPA